jgi:hypothetical protein
VHRIYPLSARSAKNTYGKRGVCGFQYFSRSVFFTPHSLSGSQILFAMPVSLYPVFGKNSIIKFQQLLICKNLPNCSLQCHLPLPPLSLYGEINLTSLFYLTTVMNMVRLRRGLRAMRRSKGAIRCSFVAGLRLRRKLLISFDFNCTCKLHIVRQQHKIKRVVPA